MLSLLSNISLKIWLLTTRWDLLEDHLSCSSLKNQQLSAACILCSMWRASKKKIAEQLCVDVPGIHGPFTQESLVYQYFPFFLALSLQWLLHSFKSPSSLYPQHSLLLYTYFFPSVNLPNLYSSHCKALLVREPFPFRLGVESSFQYSKDLLVSVITSVPFPLF